MGKLTMLKPGPAALAPTLGYTSGDEAGRNRQRDTTQPYRAWYKSADWQRLRWSVLVRDLFRCRRCGRTIAQKGKAVADHIKPHRGDAKLFWDADNLQCLCSGCHDSTKQREEQPRATLLRR